MVHWGVSIYTLSTTLVVAQCADLFFGVVSFIINRRLHEPLDYRR